MRITAALVSACLLLAGCATPDPQSPAPTEDTDPPAGNATIEWGTPDGKTLRPGIHSSNGGASCSSSFIFKAPHNSTLYIATAAHCVADPGNSNTDTNGCTAGVQETGSEIQLIPTEGKTITGSLAYSSWKTMQDVEESDADTCRGNDFALIEIPSEHAEHVHPSALHFGGPTGMAQAPTQDIYGFGASILKQGVEQTYPKQGVHLETQNGGFSHLVYLVTPGIPGDSGGFITTEDGKALGVASTIIFAPYPAANHYTDIAKAVAYMHTHTNLTATLVTWDEWDPSVLPRA